MNLPLVNTGIGYLKKNSNMLDGWIQLPLLALKFADAAFVANYQAHEGVNHAFEGVDLGVDVEHQDHCLAGDKSSDGKEQLRNCHQSLLLELVYLT
jgi:hypothetical protein